MKHPASLVSAVFLFAIAFGHVLRIAFDVRIVANDAVIPMWPSVLAVIIPAGLGCWLMRERRATGG